MTMEATAIEGFSIDGELESLLGMFNFDQCSSDDLSSLCNDHQYQLGANDHDENVYCSDITFSGFDEAPDDQDKRVLFPFVAMPQADCSNYDPIQETMLKRKLNVAELYARSVDEIGQTSDLPEKNLCLPRKGMIKPRKKQRKSQESENDDTSTWQDGQSLSSYTSSDDEKALGESNAVTNSKGKARASKGTATDPQSLYARKRRERINERLKVLQKLVPNGTKVDISTMLEEAVQYVKFLQLQIKLLSSDDLWMYAPLAYNGLDMGLHHSLLSRLM